MDVRSMMAPERVIMRLTGRTKHDALVELVRSAAASGHVADPAALEHAVIEREDRRNPLSDDQICELLRARGLRIARRTVAKYRGELGIAAVGVRREF